MIVKLNIFKLNNTSLKSPKQNFYAPRLNYLQHDTVSFGTRNNTPAISRIAKLQPENFPSKGLRDYMFDELSKPENNNKKIIELHREYYSKLLQCKSIEEAKEIYPEFSDVLEDTSNCTKPKKILKEIEEGHIPGLTPKNTPLELLKNYYGLVLSVSSLNTDKYFGIGYSSVQKMLQELNITMDKEYRKLIKSDLVSECSKQNWQDETYKEKLLNFLQSDENRKRHSSQIKKMWQDETYRDKILDGLRSEENRKKQSERMEKLWKEDEDFRKRQLETHQNEDYIKKQSERSKQNWQDETFREKTLSGLRSEEKRKNSSERMEELWQDEDFKAMRKIVSDARAEAWRRHPECRQKYSEVSRLFPWYSQIKNKKIQGMPLTEVETLYINSFYKACDELYPDVKELIGKTQKEILEEWGFYDKFKKNK